MYVYVCVCACVHYVSLYDYRTIGLKKKTLGCGYEDDENSLSVLWRFSLALI